MAEVLGCQRACKERWDVCMRSRALHACRDVSRWVPMVGGWGTASPHHPSRDVCACCWVGLEGRQKGWSTTVAGMVFQGWTLRWMFLLSSLWDIRLTERRSGASSMRCTCSRGFLSHCPAGPNGWKRPPEIFCPPWGATYEGGEILLSWKRTNGGPLWPFCGPATTLNLILGPKGGMTYMIKPSTKTGRHTNGC